MLNNQRKQSFPLHRERERERGGGGGGGGGGVGGGGGEGGGGGGGGGEVRGSAIQAYCDQNYFVLYCWLSLFTSHDYQ